MPIYEYKCNLCGANFEKLQRSFTPLEYCEEITDCNEHGSLTRLISGFSAHIGSNSTEIGNHFTKSDTSHVHTSSCGCGKSMDSCGAAEVRKKYGLD